MPSAAQSPGRGSQGWLPPTLPHPQSSGNPQGLGVNSHGEGGSPSGPSDCPQWSLGGSRGWTRGQWGLREKKVVREREEGVVKKIGAGRAGVLWVWDPKSTHHPRLLTRGWAGGGERWDGRALGEGHPCPELEGTWAERSQNPGPRLASPNDPHHHPRELATQRVRVGPPRDCEHYGGSRRGPAGGGTQEGPSLCSHLGRDWAPHRTLSSDIALPARACHLPLLPPPETGGAGPAGHPPPSVSPELSGWC